MNPAHLLFAILDTLFSFLSLLSTFFFFPSFLSFLLFYSLLHFPPSFSPSLSSSIFFCLSLSFLFCDTIFFCSPGWPKTNKLLSCWDFKHKAPCLLLLFSGFQLTRVQVRRRGSSSPVLEGSKCWQCDWTLTLTLLSQLGSPVVPLKKNLCNSLYWINISRRYTMKEISLKAALEKDTGTGSPVYVLVGAESLWFLGKLGPSHQTHRQVISRFDFVIKRQKRWDTIGSWRRRGEVWPTLSWIIY